MKFKLLSGLTLAASFSLASFSALASEKPVVHYKVFLETAPAVEKEYLAFQITPVPQNDVSCPGGIQNFINNGLEVSGTVDQCYAQPFYFIHFLRDIKGTHDIKTLDEKKLIFTGNGEFTPCSITGKVIYNPDSDTGTLNVTASGGCTFQSSTH